MCPRSGLTGSLALSCSGSGAGGGARAFGCQVSLPLLGAAASGVECLVGGAIAGTSDAELVVALLDEAEAGTEDGVEAFG